MGINGYGKLYISCEYGKGKGNGLFEEYLKDVEGLRCLHIGDNYESDIKAANQYGINAYEIKSAYQMLCISSLRKCLLYEQGKNDRLLIGMIIADLFNSPFTLYQTSGIIHIGDIKILSKLFITPMVMVYMQRLEALLNQREYDGVLFGARDGYLLKKIYDSGTIPFRGRKPQSFYFLTSRKLAIKATIEESSGFVDLLQCVGTLDELTSVLSNMFKKKVYFDIDTGSPQNIDNILDEVQVTKENYLEYIENLGIDINGNYLFCDLASRGTVHSALNKLFTKEQEGFYLYKPESALKRTLCVNLVYETGEWDIGLNFAHLLEKFLTSQESSICDMGVGGTPIYDVEGRTEEELRIIETVQSETMQCIEQYYEICYRDLDISKQLALFLLRQSENVIFENEGAYTMHQSQLIDDINMRRVKVLRDHVSML